MSSDDVKHFDLVFIGAGASCTYSLVFVIEQALKEGTELSIAIVEKAGYFHTGKAYGRQSGDFTLILTELNEFLPSDELEKFYIWYEAHKPNEFVELLKSNNIETVSSEIDKNEIKEAFGQMCPKRSLYGDYLQHRAAAAIESGARSGLIDVQYYGGEVIDVMECAEDELTVEISMVSNVRKINARYVALTIGSGKPDKIKSAKQIVGNSTIVMNAYVEDIDSAIEDSIKAALIKSNKKIDIFIAGTNASALDVIYVFEKYLNELMVDYCITCVSNSGALPLPNDGEELISAFSKNIPSKFDQFRNSKKCGTASNLNEFSRQIFEDSKIDGNVRDVDRRVIDAEILECIDYLPDDEKIEFSIRYANKLSPYKRRCGEVYADVISRIDAEGKLVVRRGRVEEVNLNSGYAELNIVQDGVSEKCRADIFFNCIGTELTDNTSTDKFIHMLKRNGIVQVVPGAMGFIVNEQMKSSDNTFVIGPMLSGNVLDKKAVWHVEHMGRIINFSRQFANTYLHELKRSISKAT